MNKFFFLVQLLFIYGINGFLTPEECLKELNCNEELNCVASCYNVPAPDRNSIIKTADCQNGCLAKFPNNLPTDWANLNQCYIDCVQNNYFNSPAEYIASVNNNNNNNNNNNLSSTSSTPDANNNSKINSTPNSNDSGNVNGNNNNGNIVNGNNNNNSTDTDDIYSNTFNHQNDTLSNNNGPINATDHITNSVIESSFVPGFNYRQIFINITIIFLVYLVFN
ncbi:hypothetical protein PIROE2DRAFT_2725 [Piromyces sp. E2]|nr:hypothetical protein PIROE2DRAFT_2725 [Piromyces sp. E2]|eukprot:OUM69419.1 hypothetical protein PIROE2DRAFT_2725 [Piromyces sp. E2]